MTITMAKAKRLCTKPELELFEKSLPRNVTSITLGRAKQKVQRARKLRDKYRKLAQQQEREARGKGAKRSARRSRGSENTRQKEQLFAEALERFQAQEKKLEAAAKKKAKAGSRPPGKKTVVRKKKAKRAAPKKKAGTKKASTKKAAPKKKASTAGKAAPKARKTKPKSRVAKASPKTEWAAKRRGLTSSGRTRTRTHVSARGRRSQARRDSRGRR